MTDEQLATIKYRADQLVRSGGKLVGFTGRFERGAERRLSVNITLERPSGERIHDQILVSRDGLLCTLLR